LFGIPSFPGLPAHNEPTSLPFELLPGMEESAPDNHPFSLTEDRCILSDGEIIERDKDYPTGLTIFPDGKEFFENYAGKDIANKLVFSVTGIGTTKFDACQSAENAREKSRDQTKVVIMLYQNLPFSWKDIPGSINTIFTALGTILGFKTQNVEILLNAYCAFSEKCGQYGIKVGHPSMTGHSLGGPTANTLRALISEDNDLRNYQIGTMATFGSPTQPHNAVNYTATTDLVSLPMAIVHSLLGSPPVFINSWNQLPLAAHSYMGPAYREAMSDAITNRGILGHE
jgi:hypothetical protein